MVAFSEIFRDFVANKSVFRIKDRARSSCWYFYRGAHLRADGGWGSRYGKRVRETVVRRISAKDRARLAVAATLLRYSHLRRGFLTRLRATWNLRQTKKTPMGVLLVWSGKRGSNPPPPPWQGGALPNELFPRVVPQSGVEPPTRGFSVPCSTY